MKKLTFEDMSKIQGGRWYWYLIKGYYELIEYTNGLYDELNEELWGNKGVDTLPPSNVG